MLMIPTAIDPSENAALTKRVDKPRFMTGALIRGLAVAFCLLFWIVLAAWLI